MSTSFRAHKKELSKREQEIMQLVRQGWSNEEMAEKLYLALSTVKNHLEDIYDKLGAKNRAHAVFLYAGFGK